MHRRRKLWKITKYNRNQIVSSFYLSVIIVLFFSARIRIINEPFNFGLNDLTTEGYYVWLDESTEVKLERLFIARVLVSGFGFLFWVSGFWFQVLNFKYSLQLPNFFSNIYIFCFYYLFSSFLIHSLIINIIKLHLLLLQFSRPKISCFFVMRHRFL